MDPIGSSTAGMSAPVAPVAAPHAAPLPSAPAPPGARLADAPAPAREPVEETPPLPVAVQRENLRPPEPPLMTREQMVALLNAAIGSPTVPQPR